VRRSGDPLQQRSRNAPPVTEANNEAATREQPSKPAPPIASPCRKSLQARFSSTRCAGKDIAAEAASYNEAATQEWRSKLETQAGSFMFPVGWGKRQRTPTSSGTQRVDMTTLGFAYAHRQQRSSNARTAIEALTPFRAPRHSTSGSRAFWKGARSASVSRRSAARWPDGSTVYVAPDRWSDANGGDADGASQSLVRFDFSQEKVYSSAGSLSRFAVPGTGRFLDASRSGHRERRSS
jgi:hypothetical protein